MPVNKTAKLQQLVQMAQTMAEDGLPVVDRKTILENADLPNIDEILERFEMLKQQQAQQAQAEQQAQLEQQMQQQQVAQEQQVQNDEANHQRELEMKQVEHQMNMEQTAQEGAMEEPQTPQLDEQQTAFLEIVKFIVSASAEELQQAMSENPEVAQIVELIQNLDPTQLQGLEKYISEQS
jgi:hypothetical protein